MYRAFVVAVRNSVLRSGGVAVDAQTMRYQKLRSHQVATVVSLIFSIHPVVFGVFIVGRDIKPSPKQSLMYKCGASRSLTNILNRPSGDFNNVEL
jgi:hypothetical protein